MANEASYVVQTRDEDGRRLYWSNADGWGGLGTADVFSQEERASFQLPIGGEWSAEWRIDAGHVRYLLTFADERAEDDYDDANDQDAAELGWGDELRESADDVTATASALVEHAEAIAALANGDPTPREARLREALADLLADAETVLETDSIARARAALEE